MDLAAVLQHINFSIVVSATSFFFALFAFRWWREFEAATLRQLSNVGQIEADAVLIAAQLRKCALERPTGAPAPSGESPLRIFQSPVSSSEADDPRLSLALKAEKVGILLELWRAEAWHDALPSLELSELEDARTAHERCIALAAELNGHVEQIKRGEGDPQILQRIAAEMSRDDVEPEEAMEALRALTAQSNSPESVSDATLSEMLAPLVGYFQDEYDQDLDKLAGAPARWIMMGGDAADRRLQRLKSRGFEGFTGIVPIDVHKAIYFAFFGIVFFLLPFGLMDLMNRRFPFGIETPDYPFLLVLSFVLALAVLLGAIIGGLRNLARAPEPPWAVYIPAALVVGSLSVGILWVAAQFGIGPPSTIDAAGAEAQPETDGAIDPRLLLAIGWVMPTFLFIAILLRGRCAMRRGARVEFCSDVAILAGVMVVSFIVMVLMGTMVGQPPRGLGNPWALLAMLALALAQGALAGGLVLGPVRMAATMSVVIEAPAEADRRKAYPPGGSPHRERLPCGPARTALLRIP